MKRKLTVLIAVVFCAATFFAGFGLAWAQTGKGPLAGKAVRTVDLINTGDGVDRLVINAGKKVKRCEVATEGASIIVRDRDGTRSTLTDGQALGGFTTDIYAKRNKVLVDPPVFDKIRGGNGSLHLLSLKVFSSTGIRCR